MTDGVSSFSRQQPAAYATEIIQWNSHLDGANVLLRTDGHFSQQSPAIIEPIPRLSKYRSSIHRERGKMAPWGAVKTFAWPTFCLLASHSQAGARETRLSQARTPISGACDLSSLGYDYASHDRRSHDRAHSSERNVSKGGACPQTILAFFWVN